MEQWGYPKLNQKKSKNTFSKRGKGGHPSSGNVRQTVLNRLPPQRDWLKYIQFFGVSHEKTKPTHFGIEPSAKSIFSYLRIIQSHMMSLLCYCDICPAAQPRRLMSAKQFATFSPSMGRLELAEPWNADIFFYNIWTEDIWNKNLEPKMKQWQNKLPSIVKRRTYFPLQPVRPKIRIIACCSHPEILFSAFWSVVDCLRRMASRL